MNPKKETRPAVAADGRANPNFLSQTKNTSFSEPLQIEKARESLGRLAPWRAEDRETWLKVGMALHAACGGTDELLDDWDSWSQQSEKYRPGECTRQWKSFKAGGKIGAGTLHYMADKDSVGNPAPRPAPRPDTPKRHDRPAVKPSKSTTSRDGRPAEKEAKPRGEIVATYDYRDSAGAMLFQVVRFDPKDFRQRRLDGNGGWVWNLDGVPRVLYRLPELLAADPSAWVFIVEGEKDVHSLESIGLTATCNPCGAGKWSKISDDSALHGRPMAILADNDEPGRRHAQQVAQALYGKAADVRTVNLPGLPEKGDVSDWLESLDSKEPEELAAELIRMAEDTPSWEPENEDTDGPVLVNMADVQPEEIRWLWPGRIPLGRISLLVGRPGEGKSFLTTDMAGRITNGRAWPDGLPCPFGSVLLIACEDGAADTIRPRLDAAGANPKKVTLLSMVRRFDENSGESREVLFSLQNIPELESTLKKLSDCKLIVIDPIGSFLGGRTDAHRDNEVRGVLAPVAALAEKYDSAILVVMHTRKSPGKFADDMALGSRGFTGIARAVWHLTRDDEDKERRLFLPGKNNLAKQADGMAFRIIGENPAELVWESDPVSMTADEALAIENEDQRPGRPGPKPEVRNAAAEWLKTELAGGPQAVSAIREKSDEAGFNWRTMQRARDSLGATVKPIPFGQGYQWELPKENTGCQDGQSCSPNTENLSSCHPDKTTVNIGENESESAKTPEGDKLIEFVTPAKLDPDKPGPTDLLTPEQRKRYLAFYHSRPADMSPAEKHARAWKYTVDTKKDVDMDMNRV